MSSKQPFSPRTPRSPHTPHTPRTSWLSRHGRQPSPVVPRSWHGQRYESQRGFPRNHFKYRNAVLKGSSRRCPSPSFHGRKRDYWRPYMKPKGRFERMESMFSSLSVSDHTESFDGHNSREELRMLAHDVKGEPFSKPRNGFFDANCSSNSRRSLETLRPPNSHDSTNTEHSKRLLLASAYLPPSSPPTAPHALLPGFSYSRRQTSRIGLTHDSWRPSESKEMTRLLRMIRQNPDRCKELTDLVREFLNEYPRVPQETAPLRYGPGYDSRSSSRRGPNKERSPAFPRVATIAGGGDSPPRPPYDAFKGHMIDRLDFMGIGLSTCASGPTTRSPSAIVEEIESYQASPPPAPRPAYRGLNITLPLRSKPNPQSQHGGYDVWSSHDNGFAVMPLRPESEPHPDHLMATYYNTVAGLSPSALTAEDWRAIRSAMAPSPDSPNSLTPRNLNIWSQPNSDESSHTSDMASYQPRGDGLWGNQTAAVSGDSAYGGDESQPLTSPSIETIHADDFVQPSRRELFRSNTTSGCPRAPVSSPVDKVKRRRELFDSNST